MKNYKYLFAFFFVLSLLLGMTPGASSAVHAQSENGWTDPVNLSNSGSSTSPSMVIDSKGKFHVFWLDKFDGYKYANSADGVTWSEPKKVLVPFSKDRDKPSKPVFLAGPEGAIHILWLDPQGALQYRRATSATLGTPSSWIGDFALAESSVYFDAVVDSQGALQIGYINKLDEPDAPAGIYYRRLDGSGWSQAKMVYPSKYYRSLTAEDGANIQLTTTSVEDAVNVYLAWDDRSQRRIFLAKSEDGGKNWGESFQVRGPEDFAGVEFPYNIDLAAAGEQVLILWQAGVPGNQCSQFSQWSTDGAKHFSEPLKVLDEFIQCPQAGRFLQSDNNFSVVLFNTFDTPSLMAWNGTRWSSQLSQNEVASFLNPVTLDSVYMGCQTTVSSNNNIYLVGCDTGNGGDIWFTSRPIGSINEWFPPPSTWSEPVRVMSTAQNISSILSVSDHDDHIHNLWVQNLPEGQKGSMIQYSRWDGTKWSDPSTVISGSQVNPTQPTLSVDSKGKLLLAWVDDTTGDMYFTWANSDHPSSASEWQTPAYIRSNSSANSSPDIVADSSDRVVVAFAVPINEERGIYTVESDDFGSTWSQPQRVFDAAAVDWSMVDQPKIVLTGDGGLHILFGRYALNGGQRNSVGLYHIQSFDGGVTWSQPEQVSDRPIVWSELIGYGASNLHRFWQEQRGTTKVTFHQYSSDGGATWSVPVTLSSLKDSVVLNNVSPDLFGNVYLLQVTGAEQPTVLYQTWDKSGWKIRDNKNLDFSADASDPLAVASSISSNGNLLASILVDSASAGAKWKSGLYAVSQSLAFSGTVPTPYPALIPRGSAIANTPQVSSISATTTPVSPLAGVQDTESFWSKNRNVLGLVLLGVVIALLAILFLSTRSNKKGKNKTA